MKQVQIISVLILLSITLVGCKQIIEGFLLMSVIIGVPIMFLMFLGGVYSNIKHKGKYSSIDGNLSENLIGLIVLTLFIIAIAKGCSE